SGENCSACRIASASGPNSPANCASTPLPLSPGAALRRVSGVRCRPGVHVCCPWTPVLRRITSCCAAPGERFLLLPPVDEARALHARLELLGQGSSLQHRDLGRQLEAVLHALAQLGGDRRPVGAAPHLDREYQHVEIALAGTLD